MDMVSERLLVRLIEVLIDVDKNGYMGRPVTIRFLRQILNELEEVGLYYNEQYRAIVERDQRVKTVGWGVLREGFTYEFSFLSFDIVGSSELVRRYSKKQIMTGYTDVKKLVTRMVGKREGRMWRWEGDGGLAAFYFGNKNMQVTLAAIEVLHELFMYNLFECPLNEPLSIRIAAHTGPCQFFPNVNEIRSDTINRLVEIEAEYAVSDSLTISPSVYTDLGTKLESFFRPVQISSRNNLYRYTLEWE